MDAEKNQISLKRVFALLSLFSIGITALFSQNKVQCSPPVISVSSNVSICNGGITTLTATINTPTSANYDYAWTLTTGLGTPNTNTSVLTNTTTASPTVTTTYTCIVTDGVGCTSLPAFVTVTVLSNPTVSVTGTNTVCSGTSTTLTASGATGYVWSPGGATTTSIAVTPTAATTYTVVGSNANGCTNTATYGVSFFTTPSLTLSGTNTICNGSSTTLNVSGASSYVWSPSGSLNNPNISNPVASPTTSTNYTVVATGANGCTKSTSYSVTVNPKPTVFITGTSTLCSGQNANLTGNGASTYVWNPGSLAGGSISVPLTSSTNYTVVGTDANGCTGTGTYSVTVTPLPTANAGPDVSVCAGDNTTLNGSGNGTFSWSPSTGLSCTTCPNPVSTPTAPITYTLTVTNACGTATDDITITYPALPSANAGPDVTICAGSSTTLNGTGSGTFAWTPGTALSCTVCGSPVATPTTTTTYTFSISASCGTNSDEVTVTVATPSVSISGNTSICIGSSNTLSATGGGSYAWNIGGTNSSIIVSPTTATVYSVTVTDAFGCTVVDKFTVNVNALPNAAISGNTTICSGDNSTLTASGGTQFVWSTGATTASIVISPTTATGYTVTVTDVNTCSDTASVMISVTTLPSVSAGTDVTICSGNSATLNASGNGSYNWAPSTGLSNASIANPVANPTTSTTYTVTSTSSCGTISDDVIVTVNSSPTVTVSGTISVCSGLGDTLVATGGGTYVWNTGSTNDSIFISPTATSAYSVTVTAVNGCSAVGNYTVNASVVTAAIVGASNICSGQSSTLTASGGGTYVWNTGSTATTIIVSPTASANYTVTATNAMGCTDAATFSVSITAQPNANVSASSNTICSGSQTTLTASGGTTYVWSPATGLNNTTVSNPVSTSTANITYTVIVSSGACADTASIGITVNALPTASITATQINICIGGCDSLFATGGLTYVWSPTGQTTTAINVCPTSAANYTVTTTDANGCTGDAIVPVGVLPQVVANVSGDTVVCDNEFTILTGQGGGLYTWNTGATTSSITVNPGSNACYTVTVSNGACTDSATICLMVNPSPTATATASPYTINIGASSTLTGVVSAGSNYNWNPTTGLSCASCPNPVATPTATTIYILTTIDSITGCTSSDTVIVNVNLECEDIFVPSAFSPNKDGFNDYLYVRNPCVQDLEFTVYNRWGQKVFFTKDITEGWDGSFHGKPVDPAVFFYMLDVTFITGTTKHQDGNVTLIR